MKNKLKKLLRFGFALLTISLLLTNCEKETKEEIQAESQESTLILKHYSKQDIEKNPKLVSRLNKFNDKLTKYKSENVSARTVYNSEYDFTINTNLATYIENGDYHSYTFPLVQDDDEKMTNVMFELNDQGEYDAFLVKYDYTANEFNTLDLTSLSLVTSMEPIDLDFNSLSARRNVAYICVFTYDSHCCDNWVPGYGCGELTGAAYYNYGCDWSLTAQYCETVYYQEEDSTTYNNNTATVTIGGTTYGGSSGGSHTSPMPSPFNAEELMKINVVKSELELNHPERVWIDEWVNGQYAFQLYDFGSANMWSNESKVFGKSAFDAWRYGGEVDLEEQVIIDKDFKDNNCLKSVYDDMGRASTFNNYLQNFDNEMSVANLRFTADHSFGNNNQDYTNAMAITIPPLSSNEIVIAFNTDTSTTGNILNKPDVFKSVAMIHEILHAEMYRKMLDAVRAAEISGNNLNWANWTSEQFYNDFLDSLENKYFGIFDYFTRYNYGTPVGNEPNDWQHEQMAQHYRDIIKQALTDYDPTLTNAQKEALSWIGLNEANIKAWQNLLPSERTTINNTITQIQNTFPNGC